jgi:hypothetical protein
MVMPVHPITPRGSKVEFLPLPPPAWEAWFAWFPVKISGEWVWRKRIFRRLRNTYVDHDDWRRYDYGTEFDVLRDVR